MMAQKANFTITLALPRYEVSFDDSLNNELETMGMGIAFDGSRADFSRLNESRTKGLFISEVPNIISSKKS
jgi:serine protease inhibitor